METNIESEKNIAPTGVDDGSRKIFRDSRSRKKIVSRDIITGEELLFDNVEKAALSVGYSPVSLQRTYLDKRKQLRGKHFRSLGKEYWKPMKNFRFDPDIMDKGSTFIKATNPENEDDYQIFEGIDSAASILNLERKYILNHNRTNESCTGFLWSDVPFTEGGTWHTDNTKVIEDNESYLHSQDSGINGRCNGKIIARDLVTGEETIYDSANGASTFANISLAAIRKNYIDKPRQIKGKHFRTFEAQQYWKPPTHFKYKDDAYERSNGYIIAVNDDGTKSLYESIKAAANMEGIKDNVIQKALDKPRKVEGRLWRKATEDEYNIWLPVETK